MREFQNWLMMKQVPSFKLRTSHLYLAPLKRAILDRKAVIQRPIRPGTTSAGMKTEAAEARLSIILGINV